MGAWVEGGDGIALGLLGWAVRERGRGRTREVMQVAPLSCCQMREAEEEASAEEDEDEAEASRFLSTLFVGPLH